MACFEDHIDRLIEIEGGYRGVKVKGDKGGFTYAGISKKHNPDWTGWKLIKSGDEDTPEIRSLVAELYRDRYWDRIMGDEIQYDLVARILFSCAVLSGPRTAVTLAQIAGKAKIDGIMGPETIAKINLTRTEEITLMITLTRIARYVDICSKDRSQSKFLLGWCSRALKDLAA